MTGSNTIQSFYLSFYRAAWIFKYKNAVIECPRELKALFSVPPNTCDLEVFHPKDAKATVFLIFEDRFVQNI